VLVPCESGSLDFVSSATGALVGKVAIPGGASSVSFDNTDGAIVVGGTEGAVFLVRGRAVSQIFTNVCHPNINAVAISRGAQAIVPVGDPMGTIGCSYIGLRSGSTWAWNALIYSAPLSIGSNVVAFDPSGSTFIVGYDDGTLIQTPTTSLVPSLINTTVAGAIRGMIVDGGQVIVATQTGILQSIPLCSCLSNNAMATLALKELERARTLGLTTVRP
jgi:hypothetical protein